MTQWPPSLTEAQIAELKASAISPEIAECMGLYSLDDAKAAAKLFGRRPKDWEGRLPVLVFPYRIPFQRDPVLVRGKPAKPLEERQRDGSIKLVKYAQAKETGTHLAFGPSLLEGPALRDPSVPLWLTEGEKKMLAAESHGLSCIALPGVHQWHIKDERTLHPYFSHVALVGLIVYLAFDADALSNNQVRKQELEFGRALEGAGARVYIVRFPKDAPKLDDFLATHELSELYQLMEEARANGRLPPDTSRVAPSEEWKPVFEKLRLDADTSLPIKDVDNITRILMFHPAWEAVLAFDARRERQIFKRQPPFASDVTVDKAAIPRAVTDTDVVRVADWLVGQTCLGWSMQPKTTQLEQAISIVCERNRFDAVRDYLVGLKWDETPRLDQMATTYFGAKDSSYTRAVMSKWMLSAVARARTPGCQVDHVIVLEGLQGIGKSTALSILAGSDYFSDTLPELGRDAHEHCVGPWIIELAELDHMRKSEVTALKAFISARAPRFRSAYARRTVEHPRRCVFAATTNEGSYLADSTGNRRFWPLECERADCEALQRDRDQLWAEALYRLRNGESWHITDPEVCAEAEEEQAARRQVDPWHPLVVQFVKGRRHVTVGDVLDYLGHGPDEQTTPRGFGSYQQPSREPRGKAWSYDQRSANRVAAILRELGWVRRMVSVDGCRVWRYETQGKKGPKCTTRGDSGARVVEGQAPETNGDSPLSPVAPVDSLYTTCARDADTDTPAGTQPPDVHGDVSTHQSHLSIKQYSGATGDSGESVEDTDTSPCTTPAPLSGIVVQDEKPRPRRVF